VTGGRWRRIVLGDVLAEHVLELRRLEGGGHPGVLVAKVGYFGIKSAKVLREQMGTVRSYLLRISSHFGLRVNSKSWVFSLSRYGTGTGIYA
jgi:hypothetical protein